tara:strand:- start:3592 stop:4491 length:900 start_codon:yes stop_codon:yes gene_type:complete
MKKFSSDYYLYYLINISLVIIFLFPIYWTIISSLKTPPELISKQQTFYPHTITFEYYERILTYGLKDVDESENVTIEDGLLSAGNIFIAFKNSIIVTIGTIILSLIVSILGGYAFTFYKFKFKEYFFIFLLLPILIPGISLIIPIYILLKNLSLLDTYIALIFLHSMSMVPLGIFMMRNAFTSIPKSLREVAILEGSNDFKILLTVLMPLAIPGILTVTVFAMYVSWNDFIYAFLFISSENMKMLNVALKHIATGANQFDMKWGDLTAGSVVSFIPLIIFYAFLQQYFVRGITGSAVKE